ncbi:MAG: hypothetical protein ACR2PE_02550 [Porticoccus sp.]
MRFILTIAFMVFAVQAFAQEMRLLCKTSEERSAYLNSEYEVVDYDLQIYEKSAEILLSDNKLSIEVGWFREFECLEAKTNFAEEEIKSICLKVKPKSVDYIFEQASITVEISRYSGMIKAYLSYPRTDGLQMTYLYKGKCKKSKKLF